jgi:hypothetical protein
VANPDDKGSVPPEITNDQLFRIKPVEHMFRCESCGREFYHYGDLAEHVEDEHGGACYA